MPYLSSGKWDKLNKLSMVFPQPLFIAQLTVVQLFMVKTVAKNLIIYGSCLINSQNEVFTKIAHLSHSVEEKEEDVRKCTF